MEAARMRPSDVEYSCVATYGMLGPLQLARVFAIDDMVFDMPPTDATQYGPRVTVDITFGGGVKIARPSGYTGRVQFNWRLVPYGTLAFAYLKAICREGLRDVNINEDVWADFMDRQHTITWNGRMLRGYITNARFSMKAGMRTLMTAASANLTFLVVKEIEDDGGGDE